MIIDNLQKELVQYKIIKITQNEYDDLFSLQSSNPLFFLMQQDNPISFEEAVAGTHSLPPNTDISQKFYLGFYKNEKLWAIIDYYEGFPNMKTLFIGLFMVDGNSHKQGIGKAIINAVIDSAKKNKFNTIRLGCIAENGEAFKFWSFMGFNEINRTVTEEKGCRDKNIIVMEMKI